MFVRIIAQAARHRGAASCAGGAAAPRARPRHAANASLAKTAASTIAPPASVAAPGCSPISTHTQIGPRIGSSSASSPSSVADRCFDAAVASRQPVPSCTQPITREDREIARRGARTAGASAPATTADSMPAIITCGSMSTVAWNLRSTVTCAAKQHDTPSASRLPVRRPASAVCANMTTMPANATIIAIHVRRGTGSFRMPRAASAARNGDTLISMFVFATVVRVSEPMKKKNVPARNAPATTAGHAGGANGARHRTAVHGDQHADDEERHEQRCARTRSPTRR